MAYKISSSLMPCFLAESMILSSIYTAYTDDKKILIRKFNGVGSIRRKTAALRFASLRTQGQTTRNPRLWYLLAGVTGGSCGQIYPRARDEGEY
jgi:hypothetical protein